MSRRSWQWTDRARYLAAVLGMFAAAVIAAMTLELLVPGARLGDAVHVAYLWGAAGGAVLGLLFIAALLLSLTFAAANAVEDVRRRRKVLAALEQHARDRMARPCPPAPPMSQALVDELAKRRCRCGQYGDPLPVDGVWQHKTECPAMAGRS